MHILSKTLAGLGLAAALAIAGAASAQTSEAEGIGTQVAHEMFSAMGFADLIRQGALSNAGQLDALAKYRPEWKPLIVQALDEAVARDTPALEAVFGRRLAKTMSHDELVAALTVFRDPQARAVFAAYAHHQTPQVDTSKPCAADCMRAMASPAGQSFMRKLETTMGPEVQGDMIAVLIPDMFITFGERAKAAEAKRAGQP